MESFDFDHRGNSLRQWALRRDPPRLLVCAQAAVFRQIRLWLLSHGAGPTLVPFTDDTDPGRWTHGLALQHVPGDLEAFLELLRRVIVLRNLPSSIDDGVALDFYTIPDDSIPSTAWVRTDTGELVNTFKYSSADEPRKQHALHTLAERMTDVLERIPSFDRAAIVSVPGHDARQRSWSERLAEQVALSAGRRLVRARARSLIRSPAKGGGVDLSGEFTIDASDVANATVVIVDDVVMSGGTLQAIGNAARRARARGSHADRGEDDSMTGRLPLCVSVGVATYAKPGDARIALLRGPAEWPYTFWDSLGDTQRSEASEMADALAERGWGALAIGDADYPQRLGSVKAQPPLLFYHGSLGILQRRAIGMCGSRHASDAGLRAARICALAAAREHLVVISGNAKGVDTEAHSGALEGGSPTILVLPEGAMHYRPRRVLSGAHADDRILVLSQFAPNRPWQVGNAMARNSVIAALSDVLVVVEAGGEGGTLHAGKQALAMGRPVIALEFESMPTPPGNALLHARGALRLRRPSDLAEVLVSIKDLGGHPSQIGLALG